MAGALGNLNIELSADTVQFMSDMGKAAYAVDSSIRKMRGAFATLQAAAAPLAVLFAGQQFVSGIKNLINQADELGKLSQKVGVTVENLSTLKYAAELSDVSMEGLTVGLKKLATNMFEASAGGEEALRLFKGLNVEFESAPGKLLPTDEVLLKLADKFRQMEDGAAKSALAVKLFGRSGIDLIPFLNQGADGIRKLKDELTRLGGAMTGEMAKQAEQFNDNMKSLAVSSNALKLQLAQEGLPALVEITRAMKQAAEESGFLMAAWVGLGGVAANLFRTSDARALKEVQADILKWQAKLADMSATPGRNTTGVQAVLNNLIRQEAEIANRLSAAGYFDPAKPQRTGIQPDVSAFALDKTAKIKKDSLDVGKQFQEQMDEEAKQASETANALNDYNKKLQEREYYENMFAGEDLTNMTTEDLKARYKALIEGIDVVNESQEKAMRAAAGFDEQGHAIQENLKKQNDIARELGLTFSSAFEDAVIGGKKFSEVLRGLATDLAKLALRKMVTEPLANAASGFFAGLIGSMAGGGGAAGASAFLVHSGGVIGADSIPRYHDGGIAGDEVHAVLQKGEGVFTEGQMEALGSGMGARGGPVFNIDARGASVEAVARLERMVMKINGSIEGRAVAAVGNNRTRGR